jgi:hypothetical protein
VRSHINSLSASLQWILFRYSVCNTSCSGVRVQVLQPSIESDVSSGPLAQTGSNARLSERSGAFDCYITADADHREARDIHQRHADEPAAMIGSNNNNFVSSEKPELTSLRM